MNRVPIVGCVACQGAAEPLTAHRADLAPFRKRVRTAWRLTSVATDRPASTSSQRRDVTASSGSSANTGIR